MGTQFDTPKTHDSHIKWWVKNCLQTLKIYFDFEDMLRIKTPEKLISILLGGM
jgi:hypothetical protein